MLSRYIFIICVKLLACTISQNKQIQEITTPFNKSFFHVLNSIRGALIAGKPSLDAKVIEENNKDDHMIVKLSIG